MTGALLDQARALLDRSGVSEPHAVRAACWVARSALDEALRSRLTCEGSPVGAANMRTVLIVLRVAVDDPELVGRAEYAWASLSSASHHHAYELAPTLAEARALIDSVDWIASRTPARNSAS